MKPFVKFFASNEPVSAAVRRWSAVTTYWTGKALNVPDFDVRQTDVVRRQNALVVVGGQRRNVPAVQQGKPFLRVVGADGCVHRVMLGVAVRLFAGQRVGDDEQVASLDGQDLPGLANVPDRLVDERLARVLRFGLGLGERSFRTVRAERIVEVRRPAILVNAFKSPFGEVETLAGQEPSGLDRVGQAVGAVVGLSAGGIDQAVMDILHLAVDPRRGREQHVVAVVVKVEAGIVLAPAENRLADRLEVEEVIVRFPTAAEIVIALQRHALGVDLRFPGRLADAEDLPHPPPDFRFLGKQVDLVFRMRAGVTRPLIAGIEPVGEAVLLQVVDPVPGVLQEVLGELRVPERFEPLGLRPPLPQKVGMHQHRLVGVLVAIVGELEIRAVAAGLVNEVVIDLPPTLPQRPLMRVKLLHLQ